MKFQSNSIFNGTITANSVANAGVDTDKFVVLNASGVLTYRTGDELKADIGADRVSRIEHQVKLGENMSIGTPVYVGVDLSSTTNMTVYKASNALESKSSKTMGLIATGGVTNDLVQVVTEGLLAGLNTSTATKGDPVWLGVDGALIFGLANKPSAPAHLVYLGVVTRVQSQNGEIFVSVQNGFEMGELHNYAESGVANNDVITWESSTSLYKPKSISTILGYTPANGANYVTLSTLQTITGVKFFGNEVSFDNNITLTGGDFVIASGSYNTNINTELLSASRNINFPDKSGVVALTSDVNAAVPTRTETVFTATANQSVFTVNYTVGAVEVFYNGSKMAPAEFTATNGTSITLASGIPAGTILTVVANGTGGGITKASLSATSPILYDANTGNISIQVASGIQNGYLSSSDWTSFNNKVSSQWVTSGSNIYYTTGAVSIGTSSVGRKFTVYTSTPDDHMLIAGSAPSVSMTDTISGATYQAKWGLATTNGDFSTGSVAGDFVISCQTGSTIWASNSVERMRLISSGKLLIGLTSTASSSLLVVNGGITGNSIIRSGGTSSQFLKADGSVDSSTYLTGITSGQVTGALGYTPYNSTNPNGYITSSASSLSLTGNLTVSSGNTTGGGIILADDGDIVDLNDGYCSMRFSAGVRVFSANRGGSAAVKLGNGGDIIASSDITAYGSPSDIRLKENIKPLENALDRILKLQGVTFDWREDSETRQYVNLKEDIGFIAQQVQEVVPELVRQNDNGYLSLRDRGMTALLVESIKELKKENNELRDILKRNNLI